MVAVVRPGSLAEEHGVIAGDYIIQIGKHPVTGWGNRQPVDWREEGQTPNRSVTR